MALDDGAEVLHVEVALEHALGEVANRRHDRDDQAQQQQVAGAVPGGALVGNADQEHRTERQDGAAQEAFNALVGANPVAQRSLANCAADEQGADIVGDDADGQQAQRVGADGVAATQVGQRNDGGAERPEHTNPGDAQRGDRHVGHRVRFQAGGSDERERNCNERQEDNQRQRSGAVVIDGQRRGDAGNDARKECWLIALLTHPVEVLDGCQTENQDDDDAHCPRLELQGADENGGDTQANSDGCRHVAAAGTTRRFGGGGPS